MKGENTKKIPIKEQFKLLLRGYKVINSLPKPILLSKAVSCLLNALTPFINIYFSAQILNELAGVREQNRLVVLIALTLGVNLAILLLKSLANRFKGYADSNTWLSIWNVYTDKLLSMDFIDIENPEIQQQVAEIKQHQNG